MSKILVIIAFLLLTQVVAYLHWTVVEKTERRKRISFRILHQILGLALWPTLIMETVSIKFRWTGALALLVYLSVASAISFIMFNSSPIGGIFIITVVSFSWWTLAYFCIALYQACRNPDLLWM